jgi:CheY-like chemotaxis protein
VTAVVRKGEGTSEELLTHLARAVSGKSTVPAGALTLPAAPQERLARVLLIEEDDDNLLAIEQVLASLPVSIQTAATLPQALDICRRVPPDLIVMDLELPGLSGLDASADIRRLPDCGAIPIIALTADGGPRENRENREDDRFGLAMPCSGYLSKPVKPGEVVSAVTRALQLGIH